MERAAFCDNLIRRQQRTLAQVAIRIVLIGTGRRSTAGLAVEFCCIRVPVAIDDLRRWTREQRLCPLSPVQQMKLALRLCTSQNTFDRLFVLNSDLLLHRIKAGNIV